MGRPIYPYELGDPDFSWLISNFQESHPEYCFVESDCLPLVFIEDNLAGMVEQDVPLLPGVPERSGSEESNQE